MPPTNMIKSIRLQNFRGFEDHSILFDTRTSVIVGKNNAGKSSIVEALRLVSLILNRYQRVDYKSVPAWLDIPRRERGVSPSLETMEIDLKNAFHRYSEPPSIITCSFRDKSSITVYVGKDGQLHSVIRDSNNSLVTNRSQATTVAMPKVRILPQIAPLEDTERILDRDYVKRHVQTSRSSRHFRNQLNVSYDYFDEFRQLAEKSWPGLRVKSLDGRGGLPGKDALTLFVQDGDFVAEVGWMGHGLQMWLQTIWFLTISNDADVIILDEPDVYMHADLQRRLIRFLLAQKWQTIVATHSAEIMSEVQPEEIVVVDRRKQSSKSASALPAVQRVIDQIGSVHNLHLARMWSARVLLLVEGKDVAILKRVQNLLFPDSDKPLDAIPHMSIGGWGGWQLVVGSSFF